MKPLFLAFLAGMIAGWPGTIFADASPVQPKTEVYWPTTGWKTSTPEEQGMSSAALSGLINFGKVANLDSVLVTRHGSLVLDAYYGPYKRGARHAINSATKAVIGTLIAAEIRQGLLDGTERPVLGFFPEKTVANLDDRKKAMTIQTLLDMTSGLDWTEPLRGMPETAMQMGRSRNWVQFVLDRPMSAQPGTIFNYNSGNPQLLSAIIGRTTGESALEYAKKTLFKPLGISNVRWDSDPQGNSIGGFGLYLTPPDMAKIGYLYLKNGRWGDKQIIPASWIERVKHATVVMNVGQGRLHYANLLWTYPDKHAFMADGYHTQIILVLPDSDIVAVYTGRGNPDFSQLIGRVVAAVKSDQPLPPDPGSLASLNQRVADVAEYKETPSSVGKTSALAKTISGKPIHFSENPLGFVSWILNLTGDNPSVESVSAAKEPGAPEIHNIVPMGLGGYFRTGKSRDGDVIGTKGAWLDDNTFSVTIRFAEGGGTIGFLFKFDGNSVDVQFSDPSGRKVPIQGRLAP